GRQHPRQERLAKIGRMAEGVATVLSVDVGGSHVKLLASNEHEPRRFASGPELTPREMVDGVLGLADGWSWDRVSLGIPTPVRGGKPIAEPINLGERWVGCASEG